MKFFPLRKSKKEDKASATSNNNNNNAGGDDLDKPVHPHTDRPIPGVVVAVEDDSNHLQPITSFSPKKVVSINIPADHENQHKTEKKGSYYQGSKELATETPLTITRLETRRKLTKNSTRLVIALVGLPARGKSFVARKLEAYMNWYGANCRIFNVGRYRREAYKQLKAEQDPGTDNEKGGACDANFFDPNNSEAAQLREKVAEVALIDMLKWLDHEDDTSHDDDGHHHTSDLKPAMVRRHSSNISDKSYGIERYEGQGRVAIYDATNSTNKRRQWILEQCTSPEKRGDKPTGVVFVESLCDDRELLEENYRYKILNSPDYEGMTEEEAIADLRNRVEKYESAYETIADDTISYIKIFNLSTKLMVNHIYGRMAKDLVPAFMAWHIGTRPIFLCRPGHTLHGITTDGEDYVASHNIDPSDPRFLDMSTRTRKKSMRGDSLGPSGREFRQALYAFCEKESYEFAMKRASVRDMAYTGTSISGLVRGPGDKFGNLSYTNSEDSMREPFPLKLLTSTMPRAADTVAWEEYDFSINQVPNLNPLDKGDYAGMEIDEIKVINPEWFASLENDPFSTRFPGGESYRDLVRRLIPVVIDVEQQVIPTLVVSHVSILQCLIAYFRNTPVNECMSIEVPMHTVVKFTPVRGGGYLEEMVQLADLHSGTGAFESNNQAIIDPPVDASPIWSDHRILAASAGESGTP